MASDGTRVFLLGRWPKGAQVDEISLIHDLDTSMFILFVTSSRQSPRLRTQNTSSTGKLTLTLSVLRRRPLSLRGNHLQVFPDSGAITALDILFIGGPPYFPSSKGYPPLYWATATPHITHEGNVSSIGYHAKCAAPHSSSEGDVGR
jgi:hypothetical protein